MKQPSKLFIEMPAEPKAKKQDQDSSFDEGIIASIVVNGDISRLTPDQKVEYYQKFCERVGLDPLSQPFKLLRLNGKEILYCDRSGAAQLNRVHNVSHEIRARETVNGVYVVTAQASLPDGRHTESIGAVTIDNLKGDNLCNAFMKAETKAKRRSTLDLLGLGALDESEVETIKNATPINMDGTPQPTQTPAVSTSNNQTSANHTSQFKRKYETVEELSKVLKNAMEIRDVANLYYISAELIEQHPDLKQEFTEKKNELLGGQKSIFA